MLDIVGYGTLFLGWCVLRALITLFATSWRVGVGLPLRV
jgi:hypothetical protein